MPEIDLYSIALLFSGLDHAYGNHYKWLFILIVLGIDFEYVGTVYRCRIGISTKKMPAHTHSRKSSHDCSLRVRFVFLQRGAKANRYSQSTLERFFRGLIMTIIQ